MSEPVMARPGVLEPAHESGRKSMYYHPVGYENDQISNRRCVFPSRIVVGVCNMTRKSL